MSELRDRLRQQMVHAVRSRDRATVVAIRSALAAMENAEAVPLPEQAGTSSDGGTFALGVGAAEVARRDLRRAEELMILRAEIDDLRRAAATYTEAGLAERASAADRGAEALAAMLS